MDLGCLLQFCYRAEKEIFPVATTGLLSSVQIVLPPLAYLSVTNVMGVSVVVMNLILFVTAHYVARRLCLSKPGPGRGRKELKTKGWLGCKISWIGIQNLHGWSQ